MWDRRTFVVLCVLAVIAMLAFVYTHKYRTVASAHVLVYDTNGRRIIFQNFCMGLSSADGVRNPKRCSVADGDTVVGMVPKGKYLLRIWLGDMDKVEHELASVAIYLAVHNQQTIVQLHNVRQEIEVLYTDSDTMLPKRNSLEDVRFKKYERESVVQP